jgi:YfiH family protein
MTGPWLHHDLLAARGIEHGFGLRGSQEPDGLRRPRQVHGTRIATAQECSDADPEADGVVSALPGVPVAVVSADCVPILLASADGRAVAAVHAGWRGLAAGVVAAGAAALARLAPDPRGWLAAIGPHIGPCCYEVDAPVTAALGTRFAADLESALTPTRPGHARLDLGRLTQVALAAAGVAEAAIGRLPDACTRCDSLRFHSFRRDGASAGRLVHYIAARKRSS